MPCHMLQHPTRPCIKSLHPLLSLPIYTSNPRYGSATYWRPAVHRCTDSSFGCEPGVYHGFFVYNENTVVHYTSTNLTHWKFENIVDGDHGYDSVVFRIKDRWILLSNNAPGATPPPCITHCALLLRSSACCCRVSLGLAREQGSR
jgi:hypothetical protein